MVRQLICRGAGGTWVAQPDSQMGNLSAFSWAASTALVQSFDNDSENTEIR